MAVADSMVYVGKLIGKCFQFTRESACIDPRHGNVALEPREYFTVEAAAIPLGALFQSRMQVRRDVLEGQCQHVAWGSGGTIMEPQ